MKRLLIATTLLAVGMLAGCAHPMIIKPEMQVLVADTSIPKLPKNVGLYISPENRTKEVTTPGGGGDKVRYLPYADMEIGIYKVLGDVFENVTVMQSPRDADAIAKHSLAYVFEPEIATNSSSTSMLTWMASDFTVDLKCKVTDATGQPVTTISSLGGGHAGAGELMKNFSVAGQRASQDALLKLRNALRESAELKK